MAQTRQVEVAARLAMLLNRTLVLPRLRCGEKPMAYPCYAWYHRAMAYFGLNHDKVRRAAPRARARRRRVGGGVSRPARAPPVHVV